MLLGFINTNITNKNKLFSVSNVLPFLPNSPVLGEKCTLPHFLESKQKSNPHTLCNVGKIKLWLIKNTCFTFLLLQIIMIPHVTDKAIINLKWRKWNNNFFKTIVEGNIKYTILFNFLLLFFISFYFYNFTTFWHSIEYFMIWYLLDYNIM